MNRDFKGIWIDREIWLDERLSALEKVILAEIDSLDEGDEHCFAGNEYFAKFFQCSESKVSKTISKLIELGYIEVYSFDGRIRRLRSLVKFTRQGSKKAKAAKHKMPAINITNNTTIKNNNSACARAREETNNNDEYNPFGDDAPDHPDMDTLEVFAANNIINMDGYNMELLVDYMARVPEALIRYAIEQANKYCRTGKPTFGYVETILKSFISQGFKSVEQAKSAEKAREDAKTSNQASGRAQKESAVFGNFY